jgi:DNA polymerase-3 subunit delta'
VAEAADRSTVSLHPIVGHEDARASLAGALSRGALPAALLLHGGRGLGKQRLALWLAQLLVCDRPELEPCGACAPCRMASGLEHPDIHWYFPLPRPKGAAGDKLVDALEQARLEEIAELREHSLRGSYGSEVRGLYLGAVKSIRAKAHKRPVMATGPVFIVGEAELLVPQESSPEAANALLKLLEEPPGGARFILTSNEPGRLLPTIRSRTVPLHLAPLPRETVSDFLQRQAKIDAETASWAAGLSQGSPGRGLGFLPDGDERGPLDKLRRRAYEIVAAALGPGVSEGYGLALDFPPAGARGLVDLFEFVEEWLRDLAAVASGAVAAVLNHDAASELERRVRETKVAPFAAAEAFGSVERARELARANVNPQLVVGGLIRDLRVAIRRVTDRGAVA